MGQLSFVFDVKEFEEKQIESSKPVRLVEVCDLPYCSEPEMFYSRRMKEGVRCRELRDFACKLFEKENEALTVHDLKFAFLKMYPLSVNLGGDDHEVTVKKLSGRWILSCSCRSWIFNLNKERTCKHTNYVENLMRREEESWGVK